jgi:hypothetical protein
MLPRPLRSWLPSRADSDSQFCARNFLAYGRDVNKLRFSWAALSLLAPILIFCALCMGPTACSSNSSGPALPSPTNANVQVAFVTSLTGSSSVLQGLQNFIVNVTGVRMNPLPNSSKTATPNETNGKWVVIPVPSATATGSGSGVVPIDVIGGQSQMQVFNTLGVTARKFTTIEVVLDTTQPGYIVPQCAGANLEGCVKYPVQLQNPTTPLQFQFPLNMQFQTKQQQTELLPIQISADVVSAPSGPGQPYIVNLGISNPANINSFIGTVTGTVKGASGATTKQGQHLHVTAALAGTNTIVAASNVDTSNGTYTLFLPASAGVGTLYDLYVSGSNTTLEAQRGVSTTASTPEPLVPAATATVDFAIKGGQTLGGFSGQITDTCTTLPITGATVQILIPSLTNASVDCISTPSECISVASATSDSGGNYPIAGTAFAPAPFQQIPIGSPTATYVIEISAPGYDTLFMEGTAAQGGTGAGIAAGHCFTPPAPSPTPANGTCSFALTTAYMQGTVNLTAAQPPGTTTTVQVMAEDTGTNNLVTALTTPLKIAGGGTSLGFTLDVPSHVFNGSGPQNLDVFAVAQDLYQGGPDLFPGHTIIVQQNVAGPPTACATVTPGLFSESMDCVGHGSIAGIAANSPNEPNNETTIELSKNGVALTDSPVTIIAPMAQASAAYNFCIPPDSYSLQRFENGSAVGPTTTVGTMATPMSVTTPCPSTCFNGSGTCPGICASTTGPTM